MNLTICLTSTSLTKNSLPVNCQTNYIKCGVYVQLESAYTHHMTIYEQKLLPFDS